jgi:hypothetical protein
MKQPSCSNLRPDRRLHGRAPAPRVRQTLKEELVTVIQGTGTGARATDSKDGEVIVQLSGEEVVVIRKLANGKYRLYSKKKDPKTGKRRNLGTFGTRAAAVRHERTVQYFKRQG